MIPGGRRDDAFGFCIVRKQCNLIVGAAEFEGKNRLQIFPLQYTAFPSRVDRYRAGSRGVSTATS